MVKLTNTGEGGRGVWDNSGTLRVIEPGQTVDIEVAENQQLHDDLKEGGQVRGGPFGSTAEDEEIAKMVEGLSPEARQRFYSRVTIADGGAFGAEDPSVTTSPTAITPQAPSILDATGEVGNKQDMATSGATSTTDGAAGAGTTSSDDKTNTTQPAKTEPKK